MPQIRNTARLDSPLSSFDLQHISLLGHDIYVLKMLTHGSGPRCTMLETGIEERRSPLRACRAFKPWHIQLCRKKSIFFLDTLSRCTHTAKNCSGGNLRTLIWILFHSSISLLRRRVDQAYSACTFRLCFFNKSLWLKDPLVQGVNIRTWHCSRLCSFYILKRPEEHG